jgi:hypothetical protein
MIPARRLPGHGLAAEDIVKQRGFVGLVAKMSSSPRIGLGGPTRSWLKAKVRY